MFNFDPIFRSHLNIMNSTIISIFTLSCQALIDTTDHEIYASLTSCYSDKHEKGKGAVGTQLVCERAKIILDEVRDLALFDHRQCLEHIGDCLSII